MLKFLKREVEAAKALAQYIVTQCHGELAATSLAAFYQLPGGAAHKQVMKRNRRKIGDFVARFPEFLELEGGILRCSSVAERIDLRKESNVSLLIGTKGSNIKRICEQYSVRIETPPKGANDFNVIIRGERAKVDACIKDIRDSLQV